MLNASSNHGATSGHRQIVKVERQRVASSEFSGGQRSCAAENFRRIRRCALQFFSPLQQASFFVDTDFSRWTKWEGEAPAEPNLSANREIGKSASREMAANGDWRLANGEQRVANSEWFSGGQCSRTAENFRRIRRCALQRCRKFSAHQNGSEWRIANSDWRIMKRQIFWKAAFLHCRLCLTIAPCAYNSAPLHTCTPARLHACTNES
jgi:hypothetical protein